MKICHACVLFLLLIMWPACRKKTDQTALDESIITKYIADNHLNATATGSGLYYVTDIKGTGTTPNINSNVTVKYTGYLTNGTIFDQTTNIGASFN